MIGAAVATTLALVQCQPAEPRAAALPVWSATSNHVAYVVPSEETGLIQVARPGAVRAVYGSLSYDSAPVKLAWGPGGLLASEKRTGAIDVIRFGKFGFGRELVHSEYGTQTELGDWSPDGRQLVFARDGHIHTLDATTGAIRYLTDGVHPTWSPDGNEIAFATADRVAAIRPDGTGLRTIAATVAPAVDIAWSPDSTRLAFLGRVIGVLSRVAGVPVYYGQADPPLAWRANGIFYSVQTVAPTATRVWRFDPDTGSSTPVTRLPARFDAHFATASADGQRIAYELDVSGLHAGVRVVDVDGNDQPLLACRGTNAPDHVRGSRLNDVIRVNSGGVDRVSCGAGHDTVYADRRDRIARDCERVRRLP